ncbi:MAG: tyrosine--tRNA ligase [Dehalococcoidia bacterium]|nr:tyrosine--tRNA ligase [Dehalococcoidia bacterium]MQF84608.1 tyrosine--tRNA ligase [SAR202 cluster bacterium]MQF93487.1 tyrosine--tRNA ligase [SAR202 cluster bacterium]|tara:strand:- start:5042 stop:6328 length:1287 start_codon:yes stop_codon:yes gene_type:complete
MPNFKNIIEELRWRNALKDFTTGADTELINGNITCYNGFDPTAKSLHIGNLIPILGLQRLQKYGHSPIVIIGGGTGMIGDPSGRSDERKLLSLEKIEENLQGIRSQLEKFLDFDSKKNPAKIINNAEWLKKINLIDFLRDTGKFFNINNMMSKDSVKNRLSRDEGISFTEFSYQLLQAYDFLYLFEEYNCTFQMGGSDQWGNIVAGVDLIRKVNSKNKAHGITYPLLTTSSGEKFGKSVDGAVTLDSEVTIPYKLFQYFFNSSDEEVLDYIKLFTDINQKDFEELTSVTIKEPFKREAQIYLAKEITFLVHGKKGLDDALRQTEGLNKGNWEVLKNRDYEDLYKNSDKSSNLSREKIDEGITIQHLTVDFDLCKSLGESKRLISQGGISINGNKILDPEKNITYGDLKADKVIIISKGKKTHKIITVD